jgi:hypothetical protein
MRHSLTFIGIALTGLIAASTIPQSAHARAFDTAVMTRCAGVVGQMKFDGWPADRNRDMMMLACLTNGGTIPGSPG